MRQALWVVLAYLLVFCTHGVYAKEAEENPRSQNAGSYRYIDVNDICPPAEFRQIKNFVISKGLRKDWGPRFTTNPYYQFGEYSLFLNPSDSSNYSCDRTVSDFNEMAIRSARFSFVYLYYSTGFDPVSQKELDVPWPLAKDRVYLIDYQRTITDENAFVEAFRHALFVIRGGMRRAGM